MSGLARDFLVERVLHRDGLMIIIDKPAGLPVHAGPGGGDTLEDYFDALQFGLKRPPALAHRLDRDTSGCLVLGRHPKALKKLGRLFQEGRVEKTYWALCRGAPGEGRVDAPLKKVAHGTGWRVEIAADGQAASTQFRTLHERDGIALVEAQPLTGRTHQIRVHLAARGAPILGDPRYGDLDAEDRARPMMLHARRIVLPIAASKPPVEATAPPPAPMRALLDAIGYAYSP
ncbi:MAG: RNA pseudouridine synthase [Parvularculaceae bacterium]|nr:RNA pseudouridine synthase [Parvularculaceae bacterium]